MTVEFYKKKDKKKKDKKTNDWSDVNTVDQPIIPMKENNGYKITSVAFEWQAYGWDISRNELILMVNPDESYARKKRVPKEWQKEWQ